MKKFVGIVSLLISFSVFSFEPGDSSFTCSFKQKRYLKKMDITLPSEGKVTADITGKIVWAQNKPFENIIIIENNSVFQQTDKGSVELTNPMMKKITAIMGKILKGNENKLGEYFSIEKKSEAIFSLIPKDDKVKNMIKKIEIIKGSFVESFALNEENGNFIEIKFINCEKLKK